MPPKRAPKRRKQKRKQQPRSGWPYAVPLGLAAAVGGIAYALWPKRVAPTKQAQNKQGSKPNLKKQMPKPVLKKQMPKPVVKKQMPKPVVKKQLPQPNLTKQVRKPIQVTAISTLENTRAAQSRQQQDTNNAAFLQRQRELTDLLEHTPTYLPRMHSPEAFARFQQRVIACRPHILRNIFPKEANTPAAQKIMTEILDHMTFVTYPEFMQAMTDTCQHVAPLLQAAPYSLLISSPDKSNTWLANIAFDMLPRPYSICQVALPDTVMHDVQASLARGVRRFVYADDGLFSGEQVISFVTRLSNLLKRLKIQGVSLFLCIPFMTERGQNKVLRSHSHTTPYLTVIISHHRHIPTVNDVIDDRTNGILRTNTQWFNLCAGGNSVCGLLVFEHKVPDSISLPYVLRTCFIPTTNYANSVNNDAKKVLPHLTPYKKPEQYADTFPKVRSRLSSALFNHLWR